MSDGTHSDPEIPMTMPMPMPMTVESIRLLEMIEELRAENRVLRAELDELRSQHEEIRRSLDAVQEELLLEIAQDRKRITKLEHDESMSAKTASRHLDDLYQAMVANGLKQATFKRASMLIGISYSHACRLSAMIEDDPRFKLVKDQQHKQRWLIRLNTSA
ncbi:MAG TPA: hypothetical protein PK659_10830 [Methanothrix sp.]|nr:hypothetical protein [Methanothrix sp.]HOL44738.1 hypothetical protein [Methanothrix sp.]